MRFCPLCRLPYPEPDRTVCVVDGTALVEGEVPLEGALVGGRYRIERLLGEGGMAQVYRAHSTVRGGAVAIKLMHPHLAADPELRERFRREAKNAAQLSHENVIEVFDAGETETGQPYIVMELLDGETLRDLIDRGPLPLGRMLSLALDIARGLARAHDLGVIHRDLKPENVFVCPRDGREVGKIVDFGIARAPQETRLTAAGSLIGTPAYIAPERVRGRENAPSSDLYSFGVVCFEMITGRLPFPSDDVPGFLLAHLESIPPSPRSLAPSCPIALDSLVLRLLEKVPEARPVDAHQVVRALTEIRATTPHSAISEPPRPSSVPPAPRPLFTTLEHWERRVFLLGQMLERAHPGGTPPQAQVLLRELGDDVAQLARLSAAQRKIHDTLDEIEQRTREARAQLGHAVHELGLDLSTEREALVALRATLKEREARAADLELQIGELRTHLAEHEADGERARRVEETALAALGSDKERVQGAAAATTRAIREVIRATPGGSSLDVELE